MQPALGTTPAVSPMSVPTPRQENAFGVGRAIARTFSAWRRHVVVFSLLTLAADSPLFLVSLLSGVPVPGVTAPSQNPFAAAGPPPAFPPGFWLAYVATMLLFLVEAGAITHGVIHDAAGKRVSLVAMVATGFRRFIPLLVVGLLCYVMITIGLVLLIVPGLFLACALVAAIPAVVAERPGVFGAIRRSFALTKGNRLAIFAVFLVVLLLFLLVTILGGFVLPQLTASFSPMLGTLLGLAINIVFGTLIWIAPGVVYHDLRVAKDGITTAQLAAIFE